jgi:hypothetical protein
VTRSLDNETLRKPSRLIRASVARGLPMMDDDEGDQGKSAPIDRNGGDYGGGLIRGAAIATRGEALGHGFWLDGDFLDQVVAGVNAAGSMGIKHRFTHPSLSGDGLGSFLGRAKNAYRDGDVARADLHLSKSAHKSPDGDLANYVMNLAAEDPQAFGTSIVFEHDEDAEDDFSAKNTRTKGEDGAMAEFQSPDPLNTDNYPHACLKRLRAVDAVDSPAANPGGVFSAKLAAKVARFHEPAASADRLASYALGLSDVRPMESTLSIDPERLRQYAARFLEANGLAIVKTQQKDKATASKPDKADALAAVRAELNRFIAEHGEQCAVWFAEGKSFAECRQLQIEALRSENDELAERLRQVGEPRVRPVRSSPAGATSPLDPKAKKLRDSLSSDALVRFAAACVPPAPVNKIRNS